MADDLVRIAVDLKSGRTVAFDEIPFGTAFVDDAAGVRLTASAQTSELTALAIEMLDVDDRIVDVGFEVSIPLRNQNQLIVPDSGRWFMDAQQPISAWRFHRALHSGAEDVRLPLYVCTGNDGNTAVGIGLASELYETDFEILEPVSNRVLNVHTGRFAVRFRLGSDEFPLPSAQTDGRQMVTAHLWLRRPAPGGGESWVHTLRAFSAVQRACYGLPTPASGPARLPVWCSRVDWDSEELILQNVRRGRALGIDTFIVDDGWFGPGLDSSYDTPLNVGDSEPEPEKFPDFARMLAAVHEQGGKLLLWLAPHAVGSAADCLAEREPHLMRDHHDQLLVCPTRFYALCLRSPQARQVMAESSVRLLRRWDIDGFKYDLFNWLPAEACHSSLHEHDTPSALVGLQRTLSAIDAATRAVVPDHVVELKQNYGTAHLSGLGTLMRAGDAPFAPQTNFLRTMHVQGYTPFALNDYQTFTPDDGPTDIAVNIIRMIAAGIPAYGADLMRLTGDRAAVVRHYNQWYTRHAHELAGYREPLDAELSVIAARASGAAEILFVLRAQAALTLRRIPATILNGSHAGEIVLRCPDNAPVRATLLDATGSVVDVVRTGACPCSELRLPPGGMAVLAPEDEAADL